MESEKYVYHCMFSSRKGYSFNNFVRHEMVSVFVFDLDTLFSEDARIHFLCKFKVVERSL